MQQAFSIFLSRFFFYRSGSGVSSLKRGIKIFKEEEEKNDGQLSSTKSTFARQKKFLLGTLLRHREQLLCYGALRIFRPLSSFMFVLGDYCLHQLRRSEPIDHPRGIFLVWGHTIIPTLGKRYEVNYPRMLKTWPNNKRKARPDQIFSAIQWQQSQSMGAAAYQLGNTSSRTITEVEQR